MEDTIMLNDDAKKIILMNRHDILLKRPASIFGERWRDGTPLGNGLTGVNLFGGVKRETFILSRADVWYGGINSTPPIVSDSIDSMRQLEKEGRYEEASLVLYKQLKEQNYSSVLAGMRCLCQVTIDFCYSGLYSHYQRILHMDRAEAEINYHLDGYPFCRRTFVSREKDIIASSISLGKESDFLLKTAFYSSGEDDKEQLVRTSDEEFAQYDEIKGCYVYSTRNDDGLYFGVVAKIVSDGTVNTTKAGIIVEGARKATVYIKVFSSKEDRHIAIEETVREINSATIGYEQMIMEHATAYAKLYNATDINLYDSNSNRCNEELLMEAKDDRCSNELLEKLWRFGRYLFISGSHMNGQPFPLYGLWASGYDRCWAANVANENVQMIYWHSMVGGLIDLVRPLIHYYWNKMEDQRAAAKNLYGCNGIYVSVYTTPRNSVPLPPVPVILHFMGAAGWLARHFYEYYLNTKDEELLSSEILPFMIEAAEFYEDYLYEDENGKYVMYPSVSPENTPSQFLPFDPGFGMHPMPVTKNATIELAIVKELLTNLIEISSSKKELSAKCIRWKQMLNKIPEYLVNKDGAIAEWIDPNAEENYFHRHLSHIYPVFPGTEIEDSADSKLMEAFEKAVDLRQLGSFAGWSFPHMSAIYARLGEREKAAHCIDMLTKVCLLDNLFTLHNDYRDMGITTDMNSGSDLFAPIQLDALLGTVNAIQEWLIRVTRRKVYILPACPDRLNRGEAKRLHFFDGEISLKWNLLKKQCDIIISALRDTSFVMVLPFSNGEKTIRLSAGETICIEI